jgi:hypothetical protein
VPDWDFARVFAVVRRVLAGFFALSWYTFPGFGLIDLTVTWNAEWPQALEAGWGLYMTLFVGVPFTVIAVRGRAFLQAAVPQLYVAAGALIVSAILATEWPLVLWALVIALETMIVAGLPSPRRFNQSARPTKLLMVPLVLGAIPWMVYAVAMWTLNRQDRPDTDITVGIDHYSVQGAYGLALLGLVTLAALWPAARLLAATCAGLSAVYLGVVSWAWHPTQGSFNQTWSVLCVLWGLVVILLAVLTRPRRSRSER